MQTAKPRILHIAQSTAGGIASYFEEVAAFQTARYGHGNVAFVVPGAGAHLPSIDSEQLICFRSASRKRADLLDFTRTALRAIKQHEPNIVHLHSSFAGAILRPILKARRHPARIVYCAHGWAFGMETTHAKTSAYAFIERQLAKATDLIHVVSRSEYDLAAQFGLPSPKMRVLPNGIAWSSARAPQLPEDPIRIAFIGRHDRQKGLDILLDVLAKFPLPHIRFDVIGDSVVSDLSAPCRSDLDHVTFHGWLSRPETMKVLSASSAVVMPSRWDAAPIVAIEAMRAGVPVIGSNRGAIPEIVEDGVGGLIFDLDRPDSLGELLQRITRDDLSRLGTSARERWERWYASDRMNQLTCEAYDDVLRGEPSVRAKPEEIEIPASLDSCPAE